MTLKDLLSLFLYACGALLAGIMFGFILYYGTYWLVYIVLETTLLDLLVL